MRRVLSWKRAHARAPAVKHWQGRWVALQAIIVAALLLSSYALATESQSPKVPPGRHPGGYPVAIIGGGIDYTLPNVAQMLARDGEGEVIGYNFRSDDRRPFGKGPETDAAEILLAEGQAATLVVISADVADQRQLANAIGYAAQSPAQIIAVFAPASDDSIAAVLAAAAQKFPNHLFLASIEAGAAYASAESASNLLIVTNAPDGALPAETNHDQSAHADLAIETSTVRERLAPAPETPASPAQIALARAVALAARIRAVEPADTPAELKARIAALAQALPPASKVKTRFGWIAEPRRHYWLE